MMANSRNGFTLLELLIAAAIIGVLALFATQAFRASASDIRVSDAKARALLLVNAAERYYSEYPTAASFPSEVLSAFSNPDAAGNDCSPQVNSPQNLVNCGFLEYRQVAYENKDSQGQVSGSVDMWFETASKDEVCVCFKGKGRVTDANTYCTIGGNFKESCDEL